MLSFSETRSRIPGSNPGQGYCVVFLGETLYSQSAWLHPDVFMGTDELN